MPASVVTVKGNEPRPLLLVIPKGWAASWWPQPALFESDALAHSERKNFPPDPNPVTDTVTFWPFLRLREGVTVTLGSGAYMAGVRPDFDVVVVSAGLAVVAEGNELAEFDEQLASTSGSIAITITTSNFLSELKCKFPFTQNSSLALAGTTRRWLWRLRIADYCTPELRRRIP